MKKKFVASVLGAVLAAGVFAAPASAGSGSVSDKGFDGTSVRMTVSTPKYVTINRNGFTRIPVTAKLAFSGPGKFTGWWSNAGYATAESINGPWSYENADFTNSVSKTKKTTITFRKYDHVVPQRLAIGANLTPEYGDAWLYPSKDHLTTVYLRNKRKVVGVDAYRAKSSRSFVRLRGTVKENVWKTSWSDASTWKGKSGVRVAIQFDPTGKGGWRTVKHVKAGKGGAVATRIKNSKAGNYKIVVAPTNRTTGSAGSDRVGAR